MKLEALCPEIGTSGAHLFLTLSLASEKALATSRYWAHRIRSQQVP